MIIKFRVCDSWQLYDEVDSIRYGRLTGREGLKEGTIDFTKREEDRPVPANSEKVLIAFMNKNQTEETLVVAYSPIYLMNNNGRTIETI